MDTTSLLPLFQEEAASPAMICHTMDVVIKAVTYLNPGQTPVLACDQPIYAMAKKIQWNWPSTYGESSIVMMFGGLHTELAALKALATWIEGSGWTSALVQAGITTPGTADSFLKASHVSGTRHAHQITGCALYILMDKAYQHYCNCISEEEEPKTFKEWRKQAELASPQFHYWSLTFHFELTILIFVKSLREGNVEHHEETRRVQSTFQGEVQSLSNVISEMGNPFLDQSGDLLILDTRDIMDATVVKSVRTVEELGQRQFQEFCTTRLDERKISLFDVIRRNKIQLFSSPPAPKETTKDKMKIASLKSNCSLFSRLYISCQVREGDLDSFFTHENQSYPPSLSQYGTLKIGKQVSLAILSRKVVSR